MIARNDRLTDMGKEWYKVGTRETVAGIGVGKVSLVRSAES
jgi:hypothetical protein